MANPAIGASFDQNDMASWYFGGLSRPEATRLLLSETESGVFLVRDSRTIHGDYVLCVRLVDTLIVLRRVVSETTRLLLSETESDVFLVRDSRTIHGDYSEDDRVSHYIINRVVSADGSTRFRIGDQLFADMPALLSFYRLHYLDTTPLVRPLPQASVKVLNKTGCTVPDLDTTLLVKPLPQASVKAPPQQHQVLEIVVARFDFFGNDPDDLPFRRGERLMVINRDEEQWWTARNSQGRTGSIPVPYVQRNLEPSGAPMPLPEGMTALGDPPSPPASNRNPQKTNMQRILPALARVRQTRVPNAYDRTALRLEEGDIVRVTRMNINGQWEGELNGRSGHFPFTYVEFLDEPAS